MFTRPQTTKPSPMRTHHAPSGANGSVQSLIQQSEAELARLLRSMRQPRNEKPLPTPATHQSAPASHKAPSPFTARASAPSPAIPQPARPHPSSPTAQPNSSAQVPSYAQNHPKQATSTPAPLPPAQLVQPQLADDTLAAKSWREISKIKLVLLFVALVLGIGIFAVGIISAGASQSAGTTSKALATQKTTTDRLEASQKQLSKDTQSTMQRLTQIVAEVQYPPSEFMDAQNAFKAQRYLEAESGYRSFVLKYPQSKVADKALLNAAVAAAMRNNCGMAESYQSRILQNYPNSPLLKEASSAVKLCRQIAKS